jgi:hypothetical protein
MPIFIKARHIVLVFAAFAMLMLLAPVLGGR